LPGKYKPKPLTPGVTTARARVSALKRHHPEGGVVVEAAVRDLRATTLEEYIRRVVDSAPPLTDQQKGRLSALLRPSGGESNVT
jgi:hypothetical protein